MNIGEAYQFIEYLANKSGSGGYIPPDQRTLLAQRAELGFLTKYYKVSIGEIPLDATMSSSMQRVMDALLKYRKTHILTKSGTYYALPEDYLHVTGFFSQHDESVTTQTNSISCGDDGIKTTTIKPQVVKVKVFRPDTFGIRVGSTVKPPSSKYPISTFEGSFVKTAPATITNPTLNYIRKPIGAIYNYTKDGNNPPVYNPTGSVSWEAGEDYHNEICAILLSYVGVHVSGDMISQFAQFKQDNGI